MIANDPEWVWRSLLLFENFVVPNTNKYSCVLTTICLHINKKIHVACDLSFIVKSEGVYNLTGNHEHFWSAIISETVLDRDIVTTGQQPELIYSLFNCDDLRCTSRSFADCKLFQKWCFVVARFLLTRTSRGPSAIAELLVSINVNMFHRLTGMAFCRTIL